MKKEKKEKEKEKKEAKLKVKKMIVKEKKSQILRVLLLNSKQ